MTGKVQKNAHLWARDENDWYVEPFECSVALFQTHQFDGLIWDPACGMGRIVRCARRLGLESVGSDILSRNELTLWEDDFLRGSKRIEHKHIVSNPPFRCAEEFVQHAISITRNGGLVAMILPLVWLSGFSKKRDWLLHSPLKKVLPISPRPSMPPGQVILSGEKPGNGTKDFAWFLWECGYVGSPTIEFLNIKPYKNDLVKSMEIEECEQTLAA